MLIAPYLASRGYRPRGIVHAGAHEAQEMSEYLALRPKQIIWIEGDPDTYRNLEKTVAEAIDQDVAQTAVCALLSARDGESISFNIFSNQGASSSIFHATPRLNEEWPHVHETGERRVLLTRSLQNVLAEANLSPSDADVLIFDLQGAEILAMQGAGPFLAAARFVEVEVSSEPIYEGAPLAGEVDAFLRGHGFSARSETPWHGDMVYERAA